MIDIDKLTEFDFSETVMIRDGYDLKNTPTPSIDNFSVLIDKINEIIEEVKRNEGE